MNQEKEELKFDYLIEGTDLLNCYLACDLIEKGHTIMQIESSNHYGHSTTTLPLREFFMNHQESSPSSLLPFIRNLDISYSNQNLPSGNSITIDLLPRFIFSECPLVSDIVSKNVYHYLEFHGLDRILYYEKGKFKQIPCSKEDIFTDESLSLIQKRKTMKALTSLQSAEESELNDTLLNNLKNQELENEQINLFLYGISLFSNAHQAEKATLKQGKTWLQFFTASSGKYCKSPYLVNPYGLDSELSQAFTRFTALRGAIYMLNTQITEIKVKENYESQYKKIILSDQSQVEAKHVIRYSSQHNVTFKRQVFIQKEVTKLGDGYAFVVVPPSETNGSCSVFIQQFIQQGFYIIHVTQQSESECSAMWEIPRSEFGIQENDLMILSFYIQLPSAILVNEKLIEWNFDNHIVLDSLEFALSAFEAN